VYKKTNLLSVGDRPPPAGGGGGGSLVNWLHA